MSDDADDHLLAAALEEAEKEPTSRTSIDNAKFLASDKNSSPEFSDASNDGYLAAMAERAEHYAAKAQPHFKFKLLTEEIIADCDNKSATSDEGKYICYQYIHILVSLA